MPSEYKRLRVIFTGLALSVVAKLLYKVNLEKWADAVAEKARATNIYSVTMHYGK